MEPLAKVQMISSHASLADVRHLLSIDYAPFIPIYHRVPHNIVGVAYLRDFLRIEESRRVIDHARSPWFVAQATSILEILEQFRRNGQSVAVALNASGESCGILSLDSILAQIFGREASRESPLKTPFLHVERTLVGDMEVADFNREFQSDLTYLAGETLSDLIVKGLDHLPAKGETVRIGSFLFTVEEPSLRGVKTLTVTNLD